MVLQVWMHIHDICVCTQRSVISRRHLATAFANAKPSTSLTARAEYEQLYSGFSRARNTHFSVAAAGIETSKESLQAPTTHQRTALA